MISPFDFSEFLDCAQSYAACPRCMTSLTAALQQLPLDRIGVSCPACGTAVKTDAVPYKYRLKLTLLMDTDVRDAMLFDEPAEAFLGASASALRKLLHQHPTLPSLLEELLLGLHISFTYQPAANRGTSSSKYRRDLKVLSIQPLARELLPKPPVSLAMTYLTQEHTRRRRHRSSEDYEGEDEDEKEC
jgi:hypothetical protein